VREDRDRSGLGGLPPVSLLLGLAGRARRDSLVRNSMYMMGTTMVTAGLGYLYWIVAARLYAPDDVGLASALIAAMTLTSSLSSLGVGATLVQLLPGCSSGRLWSLALNAGLAVGGGAGLIAGVVVVALLPLISPSFRVVHQNVGYGGTFVLGVALWTIAGLLDSTFVAERAAGNMFMRNALFAVLKIPLLLAPLLLVGLGSLGIFGSWTLATAFSVLGGFALVRRLRRGYRPGLRDIARQIPALRASLAGNHLINLGGVAPMYLLPVFVTARLSPADNAYFYTTWMMGSLFFMVSSSVATSLYAEGAHGNTNAGLAHAAWASVRVIAALLGPIMVVFLLGGRYVMDLFGPDYAGHGLVLLTILVVSAVPDAITNVYVTVLRVRRRLPDAALLNVGMALITLVLAWFLLPPLGIAGVGWAWLGGETVGSLAVALHVIVTRRVSPHPTTKPITAGFPPSLSE